MLNLNHKLENQIKMQNTQLQKINILFIQSDLLSFLLLFNSPIGEFFFAKKEL